jgi:hypothetical protein
MGFWAFGFPPKKKISPFIKGGGGSRRSVSFAVSLSSQFVFNFSILDRPQSSH